MRRARVHLRGAVQGVGFRPFVYRLAGELGLSGWVLNAADGVHLEAEGEPQALEQLLLRLERDKPRHAAIHGLEYSLLDPAGYTGFEIRDSPEAGAAETLVLPDIATCGDCLRELFDPADRRYRYPFLNCTNCGPRYSIIEALPYDRPHTSMKRFELCAACRREYLDPGDRRFHAQPTACAECGPRLALWDPAGSQLASGDDALLAAAEALGRSQVVALKGLGGFQLLADASDAAAVRLLRQRKRREAKPFALMLGGLEQVRELCRVDPLEARLLEAPEAPIVLLRRLEGTAGVAAEVAPDNPWLGVMLPTTPLHHLLLAELERPLVATSGNLSEEPICIDEREALVRLGGVADLFLVHDRPIVRHVDDSIARVLLGRELLLRRARGYAPLPLPLGREGRPALATGGQLKSTVALGRGDRVFLSQHIGDLENRETTAAYHATIASLSGLYRHQPERLAADLHPDYTASRWAREQGLPLVEVQHHHAHVLACQADNGLGDEPVLGVAWDGTGYGPDGTVWGGEFLAVEGAAWSRVARLRRLRLPGGERAVREPWRVALAALHELGDGLGVWGKLEPLGECGQGELRVLERMLERGLNAPWCSSAGRLFDAVASLLGLRQRSAYEGQAAMELEYAAERAGEQPPLAFALREPPTGECEPELLELDWGPLLRELLAARRDGAAVAELAARFHASLAEMIVAVAERVGRQRVLLTGGCFQNALLTRLAVGRLEGAGFKPYWHQRVPPNDGGLAVGQALAAARC